MTLRSLIPVALALVTGALALAPGEAVAGKDPCSAVKVKKDEWGEKASVKVGDFTWEKANGKTSLIVTASKGGWFVANNTTALPAGATLEFLFTDGSTWSWTTTEDVAPGSMVAPYVGVVIWWDVRLPVDAEKHAMLSGKTLQAFRVTSAGNDFSKGKVSAGDGEKIQAMAACFVP